MAAKKTSSAKAVQKAKGDDTSASAAAKGTASKQTASGAAAKKAPAKKAASGAASKSAGAQKTTSKPAAKRATATTTISKAAVKKATTTKTASGVAAKKSTSKTSASKVAAEDSTAKQAAKPAAADRTVAKKSAAKKDSSRLAVRADERPWTAAEIAEVRATLDFDAERLRGEIDTAEQEIGQLLRQGGEGAGNDQADVGSNTFERDHEMSMVKNARENLELVEEALKRIEAGSYGICESCGQPIGKMRLQAFPRATLCMECKQRQERR